MINVINPIIGRISGSDLRSNISARQALSGDENGKEASLESREIAVFQITIDAIILLVGNS